MSLESARLTAQLLVSLKHSALQLNTGDEVLRVLRNIENSKGWEKKTEAAAKLIPLIDSGISDEELLKVLEEMEAEV